MIELNEIIIENGNGGQSKLQRLQANSFIGLICLKHYFINELNGMVREKGMAAQLSLF